MWSKKRRDEDESGQRGFTLVETAVALGVFTIALVPTTSVFWGGLQAASVSSIRSDAVGVATSTLAQVQALPFNEVGYYVGETGYVSACPLSVAACAGQLTVIAAVKSTAFTPISTQKVGGTTFTITTYITWASPSVVTSGASETTCGAGGGVVGSDCWGGAYPQVTAVVTWGGPTAGSVTETTLVYPGGQGKWTGPGWNTTGATSCPTTGSAPNDVGAAQPSSNSQATSTTAWVTVSWDGVTTSAQPCYYVVDYATSAANLPTSCSATPGTSFQASPPQPGNAESYTVTGLNWATTYFFALFAYFNGGASCKYTDATPNTGLLTGGTGGTPPPTCSVTAFTVTAVPSNSTSKTYEDNHGNMTDNLNLVASTTGTCSNLTVQSELVGSTTQDQANSTSGPGSPWTLSTGSSGQFTDTVSSQGTAWTTGQHVFTVWIGNSATSEQQSLEVCAFSTSHGNGHTNSC